MSIHETKLTDFGNFLESVRDKKENADEIIDQFY